MKGNEAVDETFDGEEMNSMMSCELKSEGCLHETLSMLLQLSL